MDRVASTQKAQATAKTQFARSLEADISRLIADMEASIRESDAFIKSLKSGG